MGQQRALVAPLRGQDNYVVFNVVKLRSREATLSLCRTPSGFASFPSGERSEPKGQRKAWGKSFALRSSSVALPLWGKTKGQRSEPEGNNNIVVVGSPKGGTDSEQPKGQSKDNGVKLLFATFKHRISYNITKYIFIKFSKNNISGQIILGSSKEVTFIYINGSTNRN